MAKFFGPGRAAPAPVQATKHRLSGDNLWRMKEFHEVCGSVVLFAPNPPSLGQAATKEIEVERYQKEEKRMGSAVPDLSSHRLRGEQDHSPNPTSIVSWIDGHPLTLVNHSLSRAGGARTTRTGGRSGTRDTGNPPTLEARCLTWSMGAGVAREYKSANREEREFDRG